MQYPLDELLTLFDKINLFCASLEAQNTGVYNKYLSAIKETITEVRLGLDGESDICRCKTIVNIACNKLNIQISNLKGQMLLYNKDKSLEAESEQILDSVKTLWRQLVTCDSFPVTTFTI